ncbi:SCO2400 family protein [Streptomyces sp. NPDC001450]
MDYCSSCRRHLNGALVCPGCGAYAPDIAPHTPTAVPAARAAAPSAAWYDDGLSAEPTPSATDGAPSDDVTDAPAATQGRAARRRQLARWKKNKRRAAVASAVALVGGGLTLASMDRQSPDRAQAASAPDNRPMGATDGETDTGTPPVPTPPSHHRSPRATTPAHAQQPAAAAPHRQTTATAPRTALPNTHPDAAAAPVPAQTPAAHRQTTTPASDGTGSGTVVQQPSAPAPAPSTSGGTDSGASPASPSPAATSPSQLCLIVVCLG